MKRLLQKWFPGTFNVCAHFYVDFKNLPRNDKAIDILILDENGQDIPSTLGITQERALYLESNANSCYYKHGRFTFGIEEAAKHCNHPNELTYVTYIMTVTHLKKNYPPVSLYVP